MQEPLARLGLKEIRGRLEILALQVHLDREEILDLVDRWEVQELRVFLDREAHRVHRDRKVVSEIQGLQDPQEVRGLLALQDNKERLGLPVSPDRLDSQALWVLEVIRVRRDLPDQTASQEPLDQQDLLASPEIRVHQDSKVCLGKGDRMDLLVTLEQQVFLDCLDNKVFVLPSFRLFHMNIRIWYIRKSYDLIKSSFSECYFCVCANVA